MNKKIPFFALIATIAYSYGFSQINNDVDHIREIDSVFSLALAHEANVAPTPWAIGVFNKLASPSVDARQLEKDLPGYKSSRQGEILTAIGSLSIKWSSFPEKRPLWGYYVEVNGQFGGIGPQSFSSPFLSKNITAVFQLPQKIYYEFDPRGLIGGGIIVYQIDPSWVESITAVLTHKESLTDPDIQPSPFGELCRFLEVLRLSSNNPQLADVGRRQLDKVLKQRTDERLVEALFYLAINPAVKNPSDQIFWELLKSSIRSGVVSREAGARLVIAFLCFTKLPDEKLAEIVSLISPPSVNGISYDEKKLSLEDKRVIEILAIQNQYSR